MLRYFKILILLVITSQLSFGQKEVNSPYARFGPGILEIQGTYKSLGMGGVGIAMRDPLNIYFQNPASYSSLDTNSFNFDFALDYRIIKLADGNDNYRSDDMNLHHLVMGFPVGKRIGIVTGVTPYSSGYYNLNNLVESGDPDYDPIVGEVEEVFKGEGGYSKFFIGAGVNLFKGLSVGANMSFLFGGVLRDNRVTFLDDDGYYNNIAHQQILVRGLNLDLGAQYNFNISEDYFTTMGFKYSTKKDYKAQTSSLLARASSYTGSIYSVDTLEYTSDVPTTVTLPGTMAFGIAFGKTDKFTLAIDYSMTDWTKGTFIGQESYFTSSNSLNFGGQFIPNKYANFNILNRVEYRLGGRYTNSHLMVNNEQLKEFGITFGAGIPLRRSNSRINVFFEYGNRKGSYDNGLHRESFYSMGISFNFYDYWFMQRKYD